MQNNYDNDENIYSENVNYSIPSADASRPPVIEILPADRSLRIAKAHRSVQMANDVSRQETSAIVTKARVATNYLKRKLSEDQDRLVEAKKAIEVALGRGQDESAKYHALEAIKIEEGIKVKQVELAHMEAMCDRAHDTELAENEMRRKLEKRASELRQKQSESALADVQERLSRSFEQINLQLDHISDELDGSIAEKTAVAQEGGIFRFANKRKADIAEYLKKFAHEPSIG